MADRLMQSEEQLAKLLPLLKQADSVELKISVPNAERRAVVAALDLDPLEGEIRQVVFFDTPDLALDRSGVVVRARRVQGGRDDTVVKLRPLVPDEVPAEVRASAGFGVEVDAMPGGFVCSGSMKGRLQRADVREAILGRWPISKLFNKEQRALYDAHAPSGLGLDDLSVLGPVNVLKLKTSPPGLERKVVVEAWLYPDGTQIVELSTKCPPAEAFMVAAEARMYLGQRGLDLSGEQKTKTRTALEFFAAELRAAAEAGSGAAP
jgi:hypothetical protein